MSTRSFADGFLMTVNSGRGVIGGFPPINGEGEGEGLPFRSNGRPTSVERAFLRALTEAAAALFFCSILRVALESSASTRL